MVNLGNASAPTFVTTWNLTSVAGVNSTDVSSVSVKDGILAAAVINGNKSLSGAVVFLEPATGNVIDTVSVGSVPDHIAFTPDGSKLLVCNEGELDAAGNDPQGSVSIIDLANSTVQTANFTSFDGTEATLRSQNVRIFANRSVSTDVEPEYLAINAAGTQALVTLQEANAVAVLDIATATFTEIVPLGLKDYSTMLTDLSDRDNALGDGPLIKFETGNPAFGQFMPDAIASFQAATRPTTSSPTKGMTAMTSSPPPPRRSH
ncbi:MAG: hypothetical protein HC901_03300 [Bdellovibrionaceae bacterium]|nr:hypothetical protein [Pseudobdellovibrionaceae bacterium]